MFLLGQIICNGHHYDKHFFIKKLFNKIKNNIWFTIWAISQILEVFGKYNFGSNNNINKINLFPFNDGEPQLHHDHSKKEKDILFFLSLCKTIIF